MTLDLESVSFISEAAPMLSPMKSAAALAAMPMRSSPFAVIAAPAPMAKPFAPCF